MGQSLACENKRRKMEVKKAIGSAVGALALVFALVALTTNSWWQTEQIKHGLWSANINDEVEKIFIGDARGYRGLETVRGFCIILVLVSGFITSVVSLIPKWSDQMSPQVGVWTYTTSAIFIIFAIGAASTIDPASNPKIAAQDYNYGYSYALSHVSWILSFISAGAFYAALVDEDE